MCLNEQIMVTSKMPNRVGNYVIDSDKDMSHMFEQYSKVRVKNSDMFVEFILVDTMNCKLPLPPIIIESYAHPS